MEKLSVVYKRVEDLIPYVNNARTHSDEQVVQIAASIKEFGFNNPILLDGDNGVIAGHGRLLAAKKLGLAEAPCIELAGLSEAKKKAYILADNRIALNSGWDEEILKAEVDFLMNSDEDFIDKIGFSDEELDALLEDAGIPEEVVEDEPPEPPVEPKASRGEVWILGRHKLYCGDSTDGREIDEFMQNERADLYLTDPPYNVSYVGKTKEALTIINDKQSDEDFKKFLIKAFVTANQVMNSGAAFYIWHADSEGYNFRAACLETGWKVRECLIWNKNSLVMGRQDYQWKHEPCLYGWKEGTHKWYSDRKQTTVLDFEKPHVSNDHPTMKPVALFEYLIKNSSNKNDIVFDSFAGSGTTVVACEQTGRTARVVELDPHYCDVIIQRWQNLTGQEAIREFDGASYNSL